MSVTSSLNWKDGLDCVRSVRSIANPNLGFRKQLQDFEGRRLREVSHGMPAEHTVEHKKTTPTQMKASD